MAAERRNVLKAVGTPTAWGDAAEEVLRARRPGVPLVRRRAVRWLLQTLAVACSLLAVVWAMGRMQPAEIPIEAFLPAEFEHHEGLFLAVPSDIGDEHVDILLDVMQATHDDLRVHALVRDERTRRELEARIRERGFSPDKVRFLNLPFDSMWIRDYGPFLVKTVTGQFEFRDPVYTDLTVGEHRYHDDEVPTTLARKLGFDVTPLPLVIDGGNLLSNGAGLLLTTDLLLEENAEAYGYSEEQLSGLLRRHFGASETVYLEPLEGELNGHVDMFAAFTAPDVVVVGEYDARHHPLNAAILDNNARRLAQIRTACGPLRVHRIPMPPPINEGHVPTYTNITFANRKVLVPIYPKIDRLGSEAALALYRRLLPGREVIGIETTVLSRKGGSLHCATLNLLRVPTSADRGPSGRGTMRAGSSGTGSSGTGALPTGAAGA